MSRAKTQRIEIRISPEMKEFLKEAAKLTERNLSEFIIDSAMLIAHKAIRNKEREDSDN